MNSIIKVSMLVLMILCLPFMAGSTQAIGGGAIGHGSVGSGAVGVGAIGGEAVLAVGLPAALIDYNAGALSGSGAVASLVNSGTGGSGWDIVQATGADQPTKHESCQNGLSCVRFNDATDMLSQAASQSVTWTKTIMCFAIQGVNDAGSSAWVAWAGTGIVKNALLDRSTSQQVVGDVGAQVMTGFPANGWMTGCVDLTDPTSPKASYNGGAEATLGTLTTVTDPSQIRIGGDWAGTAGWDWANGELGRLVIYNADPGKTIVEMSQILKDQWGL